MAAIFAVVTVGALTFATANASSRFSRSLDDTCQSFIKSAEDADETMDQTKMHAYGDIAENIFAGLNNVVVEVGLPALSLPQDEESRTERLIVIARQCRNSIGLEYHNAVADAYISLRRAAGLPIEVPRR